MAITSKNDDAFCSSKTRKVFMAAMKKKALSCKYKVLYCVRSAIILSNFGEKG
jgi:hypothetical protein